MVATLRVCGGTRPFCKTPSTNRSGQPSVDFICGIVLKFRRSASLRNIDINGRGKTGENFLRRFAKQHSSFPCSCLLSLACRLLEGGGVTSGSTMTFFGLAGWTVSGISVFVLPLSRQVGKMLRGATSLFRLPGRAMPAAFEWNTGATVAGVITFAAWTVVPPPVCGIAPGLTVPIMSLRVAAAIGDRRAGHL